MISFKNINQGLLKILIYCAVGAITAAVFISLIVWASTGGSAEDVKYVDAPVLVAEDFRTEYLVGEKIGAEGIAIKVGDALIEDCKVELDTTTAGVKKAEVTYTDKNTVYRGGFIATVYAVRHLDVRSYPSQITPDGKGGFVFDGLVVWAELADVPEELPRTEEHPDWENVILLSPENYDITVTALTPHAYSAVLNCGKVSASFSFAAVNGRTITLNSPDRVLKFVNNDSEGTEQLFLYVEQTESNAGDGANGALGTYVFIDANGNSTLLRFSYYIDGWTSHFTSANFAEGVIERQAGDDYEMIFGGCSFRAAKDDWHRAILTL